MSRQQTMVCGLGLALVISAVYQFCLMVGYGRYNRSMKQLDYISAAQHHSDYGKFSAARLQQVNGAYEQAHSIFVSIDLQGSPLLRVPVLFYLAENYVQQAVRYDDNEQRVPLLELAKENYRTILRAEPGNWSVRVNLAKVLRILPDVRLSGFDGDDIMPERSPQAPVQTMGYDRLP